MLRGKDFKPEIEYNSSSVHSTYLNVKFSWTTSPNLTASYYTSGHSLLYASENLEPQSDRAISTVFTNPLHGANLNSVRSRLFKIAFSLLGSVLHFSEMSYSCIFIHDGTIEKFPKMGSSMVFTLVLMLEGIKWTNILVKSWTLLVTPTWWNGHIGRKSAFTSALWPRTAS